MIKLKMIPKSNQSSLGAKVSLSFLSSLSLSPNRYVILYDISHLIAMLSQTDCM